MTEVGNTEELTHECSAFSIKEKTSRGKCQSYPLVVFPTVGRASCNPAVWCIGDQDRSSPVEGTGPGETHLALENCQFTVYVETEALCVCLVQMMALVVQLLEEQA